MQLAPIVLFVYNRLDHTRQTIEALLEDPLSSQSNLFIYSDAPKNPQANQAVNEVREYIRSIDGFASLTIIEREKNYGLADSIIDGVSAIINKYEKIIVLEDDLLVSPYFLNYMNNALQLYENNKEVACITAFNFPLTYKPPLKDDTFFIKGADCWTWATWKRAWDFFEKDGNKLLESIQKHKLSKEFDFNGTYPYCKMLKQQIQGKNNSWAIRWYASAFLQNMLCLYPKHSLVENIGTDGTHFKKAKKDKIFGQRSKDFIYLKKIPTIENLEVKKAMITFFKSQKKWRRILRKIFTFWISNEKNSQ